MKTEILDGTQIARAVDLIKSGELVAFPTETVYGLGASALDREAITKVFAIKKRPLNNPLNINIADCKLVEKYASKIPPIFGQISAKFWPGPLTIILPLKPGSLPSIVTANRNSVGFRMPNNKFALELIKNVGVMVGPSANLSGKLSPVNFQDVLSDFDGKISAIIAEDHDLAGVESTILDLTDSTNPQILRVGAISEEMLRPYLPNLKIKETAKTYQLQTPIKVVVGTVADWEELIRENEPSGLKIALLADQAIIEKFPQYPSFLLTSNGNIKEATKNLFSGLRRLDQDSQIDLILVQSFPPTVESLPYLNRLSKISSTRA